MQELSGYFPEAEKIVIVQDNLNTHNPSSFYENITASEALELMKRFEMNYTPIKGSWLNMAEIEISALSKQCLDRRIPDIDTMKKEVYSWTSERVRKKTKISWRFTNNKARITFNKYYPNHIN